MTIFGPDLSHYQQGIDLARVAAEGHQFVIGKVSQGASSRDPAWARYRAGAHVNGLLLAGYHYVTTEPAAAQAANCAAAVGDPAVPLALDWEAQGGNWANFLAVRTAFRAAGLNVRLAYCPRWYWSQQGSPNMAAAGLPLWSSRYPSTAPGLPSNLYRAVTPAHWAGYGGLAVALVQFSDRASVAGQAVDCSAFEGTRAQLGALLGLSGSGSAVTSSATVAVPTRKDDESVEITLKWAADGVSFRGVAPAECGSGSARYKGGWVKVSCGWGGVSVRMCARDAVGKVMGPANDKTVDIASDHNDVLPLPDGCASVTVEGKLAAPGALVSAVWIPDPR